MADPVTASAPTLPSGPAKVTTSATRTGVFSGPMDITLPASVQSLSAPMRAAWVNAFNAAYLRSRAADDARGAASARAADAIVRSLSEAFALDYHPGAFMEGDDYTSGRYVIVSEAAGGSVPSTAEREKMSSSDFAGKNKSFPINSPAAVRKASRALGRAGPDNYSRDKIKANIIRIAKAKGDAYTAMLPKSWRSGASVKEGTGDDYNLGVNPGYAPYSVYNEDADFDDDDFGDFHTPTLPALSPRVQAMLPEGAHDIWLQTYNQCAILGGAPYQCENAAYRAIEEAGYVPADLPKYVKVGEGVEPDFPSGKATPAPISLKPADAVPTLFIEAEGSQSGSLWDVVLIRAGRSANRRNYSEGTLRKAAPLFEGTKAYADHDLGKVATTRSVRELVGWYDHVLYSEAIHAITARFHVLETARWLKDMLLEITQTSAPDLIGLSINAEGEQKMIKEGSELVSDVTSISRVHSVDVVTEPAAGGVVVRLVASSNHPSQEGDMDPEDVKEYLKSLPDADRQTLLSESGGVAVLDKPKADPAVVIPPVTAPSADPAIKESVDALSTQLKEIRLDSSRNYVAARMAESRLPAAIKTALQARVDVILENRPADKAEVDLMFKESTDLWAALEQSSGTGRVRAPGGGDPSISMGNGNTDKLVEAIDGMFDNKDVNGTPRFNSLKQAYAAWKGTNDPWGIDPRVMMAESHSSYDSAVSGPRLLESFSTATWGNIFADRLFRKLIQEYQLPYLDDWRKVVSNIENITDFRTQRRERIGGYGLLGTVGEGVTYPMLTSPSDEEATYALAKRGGLDDITFEMIANDDLRAVRNIPVKLARAAKQTLFRFVFDIIATNGFSAGASALYDTFALYDNTNHANLIGGATPSALSDAGLADGWQRMRQQKAFGSSIEFLGTRPRYIWVPTQLEQLAWRLANSAVTILSSNYNATEPNFFNGKLEVIVLDYLTDTNNWGLIGDPTTIPTIELGFFNGNEDPEMFVQDTPNIGSVMTADKITYKIRHIYSGTVLDYRGFAGSNPA